MGRNIRQTFRSYTPASEQSLSSKDAGISGMQARGLTKQVKRDKESVSPVRDLHATQ